MAKPRRRAPARDRPARERALHESAARYRALFEHATDLIIACTLDGAITGVNRAVETTLGWSRDELIGRSVAAIVTPASFAAGEERVRRALAGEALPKIFEMEAMRKDGGIVPLEGWARFIHDAGGHVIGHHGVYRDISERKRAEEALRESEERYRALFDNASDMILTFALDGTITSVNLTVTLRTGWSKDELVGQPYSVLVAPALRGDMEERLRRALAGEKLGMFEVEAVCKDGSTIVLEGRARFISDRHGTPMGIQGIYRDVTERKRAEHALRESEERYRELFRDAEERREVLDRLYGVAAAMQTSWDPADRLRAFARGARDVLGFDRFYVMLASADGSTLDAAIVEGPDALESMPLSPALGPLYEAFQGRRTVAVLNDEDLARSPRMEPPYRDQPFFRSRRFVVAPLLTGDRVIGVAGFDNKASRRPISAASVELLTLLCQQLATALEEARLYAEARAREQEATKLYEVTAELAASLDLERIVDLIVEKAVQLIGCDASAILQYSADRGGLGILRSCRLPPEFMKAFVGPGEGIAGRVFQERRPLWSRDIHVGAVMTYRDADTLAVVRAFSLRGVLAVPIVSRGEVFGVIAAYTFAPHDFSPKEIQVLSALADHAAIAIENARLVQDLDSQRAQLEALSRNLDRLYQLSTAMQEPLSLGEQLTRVLVAAGEFISVDRFHAWALSAEGDRLVNLAGAGWTEEERRELAGTEIPLTEAGAMYKAYRERTALVFDARNPLPAELRLRPPYAQIKPIRTNSFAVVPMVARGRVVGVLAGDNKLSGRPIPPRSVELLQAFASHAAVAVDNARLFEELQARTRQLARSVEQLTALGEVGQAVTSTLDLQTVLTTITARAVQLSGAAGGVIYEYDESAQEFRVRASERMDAEHIRALEETPVRLGEGAVGRAGATRAPVEVADILAERQPMLPQNQPLLVRLGYRSLLAIPLLREQRLLGGLVVWRTEPGALPREVVDLLQTFAAQSALAIQNARLFQELGEKSRQLEIASRHKSEFLASMSHELRTPLNAIIGYSEMLEEEAVELGQESFTGDLRKIHAAGKHLLELINAVLDLSKIEAGKMELYLEEFGIPELVRDIAAVIQPLAERKSNRLVVECPENAGVMRADLTKVRQALFNLLSNACKFTERGTVTLAVERQRVEGGNWLVFSVTDTGIGMTPEQLSRLFLEFTQVEEGAARRYGGTGLGLALSRRLCRMMGGDITVESERGRGSTFTIRLPSQVTDPGAATAEPAALRSEAEPGGGSTVLVIDDAGAARDLLHRTLTKEGFRVALAPSGEEGLRLARELRPDAITLDVMMPSMTVDPSAELAHLRHELRTPLNHVIGYAELLLEEAAVRRPELTAGLQDVRRRAHEVLSMINEALAAPSAETGAVDLEALAAGADPRLEEILDTAAALRKQAEVVDEGSVAADLDRISSSARDLRVLLRDGVKTTHRPEAPGRAASGPAVADEVVATREVGTLLVVDDDAENREVLARRLVREGHRVHTAADGVQALDAVGREPLDLILLDVMMPGMDGVEVLRRLKGDEGLRHIPVLMISALGEMDNVVRCIELGAEDYLPKPFDPVLLRARIGACLEKKRLRDREVRHLAELAEWNRTLERRVAEKVAEVERLGRLMRFVPPQLAELIAAGAADDPLRPHRREIVVAILDLDGYGPFMETAEPEESMGVLRAYHTEMGRLIAAYQGTVERFVGDAISVIFNDPVEMPDAAERAVGMALAMRERFAQLAAGWRRRGWELGLTIGIAQGYATIGAVGFEGRLDYAAMGRVMALASGLCGIAAPGQILVTTKVAGAVEALADLEGLGDVTLRSLARPVEAFSVRGLKRGEER